MASALCNFMHELKGVGGLWIHLKTIRRSRSHACSDAARLSSLLARTLPKAAASRLLTLLFTHMRLCGKEPATSATEAAPEEASLAERLQQRLATNVSPHHSALPHSLDGWEHRLPAAGGLYMAVGSILHRMARP